MAEIPLTKGYVALVDDEDVAHLSQWSWGAFNNGSGLIYARATIGGRKVFMHRLLCPAADGVVDHINRRTLDNRRSNLRPCSATQNTWNRKQSGSKTEFTGVVPRSRKTGTVFSAKIGYRPQRILGTFPNRFAAAVAYDDAAIGSYGEFAQLNFPDRDERWLVRFAAAAGETDCEVRDLLLALGLQWSGTPAAIEVASGKGGNPSVLSTDQRHQEVAHLHGPTMERMHEPSPEIIFPENGNTRDDHVPSRNC